ncbi:hypothetical protein P170DRAFT_466674 [Aspergillus steynii IBT 23096]|uniref:Mid2 domain-containing protein n=1 Tax=Aspergillus steynii IBT 23096 TaxID=1392250 RepID=A0A2I2G3G8_9EURO|nr:uncharacterized protein P170DRAFT_466674 [Aspergillus steynii IBT 23096]PLB47421.1 hypothetical protein P170DRAFT_466674 [Aspergillus steynii IBT 23096]
MTTEAPQYSIPPDWSPSKAGCLRKEDYWLWFWPDHKNDNRTVLGGPSQTTDCFPPTWAASDVYVGTNCPPSYTSASCEGSDERETVTCCPDNHRFTCAVSETQKAHGSYFPCRLQYTKTRTVPATLTDFVSNTINVDMVTQKPGLHLYALGVLFVTPTATTGDLATATTTHTSSTSSATSSSTASSEPDTSSSSLSAGASAGIGVGAAAGVIIIAAMGWFWYRRKKAADAARAASAMPYQPYVQPVQPAHGHQYIPRELETSGNQKQQLTELPS